VADLMTTSVVTALEDTTFGDLVHLLERSRVGMVPVVGVEGGVVGVISMSDLVPADGTDRWRARIASELMSTPAVTVTADQFIEDAAALMWDRRLRRLPVVDPEGRPMGLITGGDVVRALLREDSDGGLLRVLDPAGPGTAGRS